MQYPVECHDRYVFQYNPEGSDDLEPTLTISCPGYPLRSPDGRLDYFPAESITLFSREAMYALRRFLAQVLVPEEQAKPDTANDESTEILEEPHASSQYNSPNPSDNPTELSASLGKLFGRELRQEPKSLSHVVSEL